MKLPPLLAKLFPWLLTPKPAPSVTCLIVPAGPVWFRLGGWSVERHVVVSSGWSAMPHCWVSPNRRHAWTWQSRTTPLRLREQCSPGSN